MAAYRLAHPRLDAPHGRPQDDERLARDVAGGIEFTPSERMARYLQARTAFFDRVVVNSLGRGVTQIAAVGAGYDGRALRYEAPGVRWFELDHPATQTDKRQRLERLGIPTPNVTFVAVDFVAGGTAAALQAAGWNPDAASLMLCEGVAVYLPLPVFAALLADLRALATAGTRLALSLMAPGKADGSGPADRSDPAERPDRERFRERVAALGEPVRNELGAEDTAALLAEARWRPIELSESARRVGFTVAAPAWEPAADGAPPTAGRIGAYLDQLFGRRGLADLPGHLEATYGIDVAGLRGLDAGVFRVARADGPDWLARVFPAARPLAAAQRDADILRFLASDEAAFPAERCAAPEAVTTHAGQAVLVTEFVPGGRGRGGAALHERLGDLLGRLHALAVPAGLRPGGAWHHVAFEGRPRDEIDAILALLEAASARVPAAQAGAYDELHAAVAELEDGSGLPEALVHPDFVPANARAGDDGAGPTIIDWTGAGLGPRVWSLGCLLWAADRHAGTAMAVYARHVRLQPGELERLAGAVAARWVGLAAWAFATGREPLADVVARVPDIRRRAERIAARAQAAAG